MADASVTVVIEGQDNASGAIRSVTANLNGLEAQSGKTVAAVSGVNAGISQSGTSATRTAGQLKQYMSGLANTSSSIRILENDLNNQKQITQQYTVQLKNASEQVGKMTAQQAKAKEAYNTVTAAARSFGELIMPSVSEASGAVMKYAQNLASMDAEQKAAWINTAKGVVVTGLATKGIVTATKGVGGAVEAIGKMKPLISGIAKAAPFAASAMGPVAVGIAGIAAAVAVGKAAYDAWYTSQYRWSEGLSEGNQKVKESLENYKRISEIQGEVKSLKLIIENPDSSAEQVENAKQRLEEIKQLLSEEYNLVIKTDNSNLDSTLDGLKKLGKNELQDNINSQKGKLTDLLPKIEGYDTQKKALESQLNLARETAARYGDFRLEVANLDKESIKYGQTVLDMAEKYGILSKMERKFADPTSVKINADLAYRNAINEIDSLSGKLTSLTSAKEEVRAITEELANWETEMIKIAAQNGDTAGIQQALKDMKGFIDIGELDMEGYAQAAALAMNGIDSLETAWSKAANGDGQALNGIVNDYIRSMRAFGASAEETATGAALIQNGFRTIGEAVKAGKLDVVIEQANQIAHAMGLLPESKKINISAEGDVTIVDTVEQQVKKLDGKTFAVTVNTEGDTSGADEVDEKIKNLDGKKCTVTFTADGTPAIATINGVEYKLTDYNSQTGTATLLAENGQAIGVIDLTTGKIYSIPLEHETNITAQDNTRSGVESAKAQLNSVKDKSVTITVRTVLGSTPGANIENMPWRKQAQGTQNFSGGLAMVNDQTGISDNRELIIDRGKAFIPQGKNVILPLSRGAKVYTAAQTKAIMSGLGIPHYAAGKDNSDAFTNARDDWTHYTRTHAVTSAQELEKCNQLLKESAQNAKDVADAEEMIYSAQVKVNKELDEASAKYIENRTFNNDWEDYGDTPIEAFNRYKERQYKYAADSQQTWEEADKNIADFGEKLLEGRIQQSLKWIEHQKKYNNMPVEDELAALQTIQSYTLEFYEKGLIQHEKYREQWTEIDERFLDGIAQLHEDEYANWEKSKDNWIRIHDTYDDWDEIGDSLSQVYARSVVRVDELHKKGVISSWQEAEDAKLDYSLKMYEAASDEYDALLAKQSDRIREMQEEFSKQEEELRTSWDVADRSADLDEVNKLIGIYKNAVTGTGRDKYKELLKQKEQLERDEQLYQLQQKNNGVHNRYHKVKKAEHRKQQ